MEEGDLGFQGCPAQRYPFCMPSALLRFSVLFLPAVLQAGVGDPQLRTDHPWYPGELALSTFDRLFATQAEQYERATGIKAESAEDKALASWFFRNTHYAHGEEGREDLWGEGFSSRRACRSKTGYCAGCSGCRSANTRITHCSRKARRDHRDAVGRKDDCRNRCNACPRHR